MLGRRSGPLSDTGRDDPTVTGTGTSGNGGLDTLPLGTGGLVGAGAVMLPGTGRTPAVVAALDVVSEVKMVANVCVEGRSLVGMLERSAPPMPCHEELDWCSFRGPPEVGWKFEVVSLLNSGWTEFGTVKIC